MRKGPSIDGPLLLLMAMGDGSGVSGIDADFYQVLVRVEEVDRL
jgi:hypothetical protein